MNRTTFLAALLWAGLALDASGQQTQPTPSGANTGSPQAGNSKAAASANQTPKSAPAKPARGRGVNTRTTGATASAQEGTHNGVRNPGSSANPRVHAANAQKTDKPALGGDAGQGTPGVHSRRKTEAQKYSGTQGASGGGGPRQ